MCVIFRSSIVGWVERSETHRGLNGIDGFRFALPILRSAHFAVLREADLVESEKAGTTVTYSLKVSVLEDALLSFAETVGLGVRSGGKPKLATRRGK